MLKKYLFIYFFIIFSLSGCKSYNKEFTTTNVSDTTKNPEEISIEDVASESLTIQETNAKELSTEKEEPTTVTTSIQFNFESISHCIVTNGTTGDSIKLTSPELDNITTIFADKEWTLKESGPITMGWSINIKFYASDSSDPIYEIINLNDDNIVIRGDDVIHYYVCDDYYFDREWFDELTANEKFQY